MAEKAELTKIKVPVENHTHNGKPVPKGTEIEVDQPAADMLIAAWKKQLDAEKAAEGAE